MLSQKGEVGESVVLFLELKLLADVGLLAKPNAGKSTLISHCSAAQPKIADYPFTTVEPVLGVVANRGKDFVMMEVPGLIEGAHEGVGLGDQFLRHAERARLYIHLVDGLSPDPVADFNMINDELRWFNPALAEKPQVVAVNKIDVTEVRDGAGRPGSRITTGVPAHLFFGHRDELPGGTPETAEEFPIFFISAATGEGIDPLLGYVIQLLDLLPKEAALTPAEAEKSPAPELRSRRPTEPIRFHKENGVYVVKSEQLERLSALADTRDYRVLLQLWREMNRLGIARQLEEAGIEAGDTIRIGRAEMEWF